MADESERAEAVSDGTVDRRANVHPLDLPRLIGGVLGDIRAIAEGMAVLPRLLEALNSIESRVDALNQEVVEMRQGVQSMGGDVTEMRAGVERVEPHLEAVSRVIQPIRRLTGRARRQERDLQTGEERVIEVDFLEEESEA
jgi:chromosome segregation ATPase